MATQLSVENWQFWCWSCKNRTCSLIIETPNRLRIDKVDGNERHLTVRVLTCDNCDMPTVLGTYTYYNEDKGWGARGGKPQQAGVFYRVGDTAAKANAIKPNEYVAFQRPGRERELPLGLTRKVKDAFREAERAVDNNMPISGAAAIRTTIRLIIESEGLNSSDLDSGIKALNLKPEFMRALGNLKLVGDHSLHYEEYKIEELANALEVLHLSIDELFAARQRLALLEKAVGNKASNQGKSKGA